MEEFKKVLFFPVASYFKFFARIRLQRWHPRVIAVTGSSGKTTLLHLIESQIGEKAKYSHHANSSFGIPFDILDLHRETLQFSEWFSLFFKAPFASLKTNPKEKIYVVEVDTDRPGEGEFLAELLRPEVVLWVSLGITHGMNFDDLVKQKKFGSVEEAIAYDYGFLLEYCSKLVTLNGDIPSEVEQSKRTKAKVVEIAKYKYIEKHVILPEKTEFVIKGEEYSFAALLPEEIFYSIAMCKELLLYLDLPFDGSFSNFVLPPGRSSLFQGIKNTTIIDSTYNANLISTKALLTMFRRFPSKKKWVILGDMLELGELEKEEHEELSTILSKMDLQKIILFGPRSEKYTAKKLEKLGCNSKKIITFQSLNKLDTYIHENLSGGEALLFKGSQSMFLETVIEGLLKNKEDREKLPRRGKFWDEKRNQSLQKN